MPARNAPIPVARVIAPESLAIIGATDDYAKFGGRMLHHVVEHGYAGRIYPVNKRAHSLLGIECFADIESLPEPPDLVLVSVPAFALADTIAACGRAGAGACVVVTAQMAEFNEEGARLEQQIVEIARAHRLRLVGPNCMGMIVPAARLALSSTPTLRYAMPLRAGNVALVSQSGALMGSLFVQAHDAGVGVSGMVSIGNQADLELCDFVEAFLDRDDTDVVCLYVEGLKDPMRLRALGLRAQASGKRLLAVKAGRTAAGSAMTQSHTSSLAGSYSAFEALCRESGILLTDDPESMILCAGVLACNPPARAADEADVGARSSGPDGERASGGAIGVVCASGGGGAIMADRFAQSGLALVDYAPATREHLAIDYQPAHQNNPLDLGAHKGALEFGVFQRAIDAVYEDPGVSVFVYVMTPQPLMPETIEHLITLWRRQHKPVVVVMNMAGFGHSLRERLVDAGLPFVTRTDDLFRAVSLLLAQADSPRMLRASLPSRPATVPAPADRAELPVGALTEPQAKALASHYGIAVPGAAACASAAEAVAAARAFGHPVVLKGVAAGVVHKSELGLVRLGLEDDDAVASAFADIARAIEAAAPGQPIRIDVQQTIGPGVELIVGLSHEPGIGAQVVVGAGGLYVELLQDVAQMRAPVSPRQAGAMLKSLRIWPLLAGARGQPPAAVDALGEAIARLSWLASDLGDALVDFEINPLRVSADAVWALDARATLSPARPTMKP